MAFPATGLAGGVTVAQRAGSSLVVSGLDKAERNRTVLYDTTGDTGSELIGPDREIEIYHIGYLPDAGKVIFDGLRFADNRYVIGEINLGDRSVTISTTLPEKPLDFQAFG